MVVGKREGGPHRPRHWIYYRPRSIRRHPKRGNLELEDQVHPLELQVLEDQVHPLELQVHPLELQVHPGGPQKFLSLGLSPQDPALELQVHPLELQVLEDQVHPLEPLGPRRQAGRVGPMRQAEREAPSARQIRTLTEP